MRWHNRYELREPIAGAPGSFRGCEKGSENPVILHQLPNSDCALLNGVLRQITELPHPMSEHVRDIWEFRGALHLVTDLHFGEVALAGWLERARGAPASIRAVPSEFTQFFLAPTVALDSAPEPASTVRSTEPRPGEFTRFMSSSLTPDPAIPAAPAGLGELSRLFQTKPEAEPRALEGSTAAPVPPLVAAPQRPVRPVGDFTRFLGPMPGSPAAPSQESLPQPKVPAVAVAATLPTAGPGAYTRVVAARRLDPPAMPPTATSAPAALPPKRRGNLIPMLVFSGLGVLALALILVFALWR